MIELILSFWKTTYSALFLFIY